MNPASASAAARPFPATSEPHPAQPGQAERVRRSQNPRNSRRCLRGAAVTACAYTLPYRGPSRAARIRSTLDRRSKEEKTVEAITQEIRPFVLGLVYALTGMVLLLAGYKLFDA